MADSSTTGSTRGKAGNSPPSWLRSVPIWLWILALAIVVLTAAGYQWTGALPSLLAADSDLSTNEVAEADQIHRLPVRVQAIARVQQISRQREYTGIIRARRQAGLGFELSGRLDEVLSEEGGQVSEGQALARLDTQTLQARRAATKASLDQALAVLQELQAGPRVQTVESARAQLNEAKSRLKIAELDFARRKKLQESKSISVSEFEASLYRYREAESNVNAFQKQLDELQAGTRPERIAAQAAAVAALDAALQETDVQIEKSFLKAPFAGRIVQRMADPGEIISPSQPILRLVETEKLEAVVGLPPEVAVDLYVDQTVPVTVAGQPYDSRILAKIQQLDTTTRTQDVILQLAAEADGQVLPGQLCEIEIETQSAMEGFWVPANSLKNGIRGLWTLLIVDSAGDQAVQRDVEVIYSDGKRALVRGPLQDGNRVIVDGTHRIVAGQPIRIINDHREARSADSRP